MPSLTRLAAQLKDEKLLPSTNAEPTHPQPRSRLGRAPLRVDGRALRLFRIFVFDTYLCYTALCLLVDLVGWRYPSVGDGVVQWVFEGAQANAAAFEAVCPQQAPWVAPNGTIDVAYPENDILARRLSGAVKVSTTGQEPKRRHAPDPLALPLCRLIPAFMMTSLRQRNRQSHGKDALSHSETTSRRPTRRSMPRTDPSPMK